MSGTGLMLFQPAAQLDGGVFHNGMAHCFAALAVEARRSADPATRPYSECDELGYKGATVMGEVRTKSTETINCSKRPGSRRRTTALLRRWITASGQAVLMRRPPYSSARAEVWLCRFPLPSGGDHGSGVMVPAVPGCPIATWRSYWRTGCRCRSRNDLSVGAALHPAAARRRPTLPTCTR